MTRGDTQNHENGESMSGSRSFQGKPVTKQSLVTLEFGYFQAQQAIQVCEIYRRGPTCDA